MGEDEVRIKKRKTASLHRNPKALVMICLIIILVLSCAVEGALRKPFSAAAIEETRRVTAELLHSAMLETLQEYASTGKSEQFTRQETNDDGSGLIYIDSVKLGVLSNRIIALAQQKLRELASIGVGIPAGTVSGLTALNGKGRRIWVGVEPLGPIIGSFSSSFTAAGVNQTKYSAFLEMKADIGILLSGKERTITVSCSAPIVEAIVVGGVPHAYTDVSGIDDALNLIPTDAD